MTDQTPGWLTKHCATPKCNTTIRWYYSQPMGSAYCKWCTERVEELDNDHTDSDTASTSLPRYRNAV